MSAQDRTFLFLFLLNSIQIILGYENIALMPSSGANMEDKILWTRSSKDLIPLLGTCDERRGQTFRWTQHPEAFICKCWVLSGLVHAPELSVAHGETQGLAKKNKAHLQYDTMWELELEPRVRPSFCFARNSWPIDKWQAVSGIKASRTYKSIIQQNLKYEERALIQNTFLQK